MRCVEYIIEEQTQSRADEDEADEDLEGNPLLNLN